MHIKNIYDLAHITNFPSFFLRPSWIFGSHFEYFFLFLPFFNSGYSKTQICKCACFDQQVHSITEYCCMSAPIFMNLNIRSGWWGERLKIPKIEWDHIWKATNTFTLPTTGIWQFIGGGNRFMSDRFSFLKSTTSSRWVFLSCLEIGIGPALHSQPCYVKNSY